MAEASHAPQTTNASNSVFAQPGDANGRQLVLFFLLFFYSVEHETETVCRFSRVCRIDHLRMAGADPKTEWRATGPRR